MSEDLDSLLPAIARADADAFARFLALAESPVRLSLLGFARSVDTEAVLQEAFLRTWQVAQRCEPDGKPNALLRLTLRIARNLAIDETRRRRRSAAQHLPLDDDTTEAPSLAPSEVDPLLRRTIHGCFDDLPPRPALAMRTRVDDGGQTPDSELAARCRMTANTFLQNITRARRLLAECLKLRAGLELGT